MTQQGSHTSVIWRGLEKFFMTWRFPSFMLLTLFFFWVLIMVLALMPVPDSSWGVFAEDFKVWCFGYDPETGSMELMYLFGFTIQPIILSLVIWFVWRDPLTYIVRHPLKLRTTTFSSLGLVFLVGISFPLMFEPPENLEFEFNAAYLRTGLPAPEFELINAHGEKISSNKYDGKVVILTSIYASCAETCPLILDQVKNVLNRLDEAEREETMLMAITMHPEKDTPDLLRRVSEFYRLGAYPHHLLTGEPDYVHDVLDFMNIARKTDDITGEISHVNLFLIKDRAGKIAFRFALGQSQEDWMVEAIRLLIDER